MGTCHLYQKFEATKNSSTRQICSIWRILILHKPSQLECASGYLPVFSCMSSEIFLALGDFLESVSLSLEKSQEYQGLWVFWRFTKIGESNIICDFLMCRTLTAPVDFKDCIVAIRDNAFYASEYPVILTLEDHLPSALQKEASTVPLLP